MFVMVVWSMWANRNEFVFNNRGLEAKEIVVES